MGLDWNHRSKHDKGVIFRTAVVVIMMLLCGCLLDSEDWSTFLIVIVAGSIYLTVFSIVNYDRWR